jgi:FAD/FMN-containing dehydrogenase
VPDIVHALNGSISAEHGIGQLKREEILRYKSPVELAACVLSSRHSILRV